MIAKEITARMQADKCLTPSRSRSHKKHRNYSNKYTKCLGERGYHGIRKDGYFSKFYSYGVVGHCAIFVEAHLIWAGYPELVPNKGYIMNTNEFARWLRSEPYIKGLGRVDWTTDTAKVKKALTNGKFVVVFKGEKGHESYTHTCSALKIQGGYIWTVDGNVTGRYKGKKINNGVRKKRKLSSYRWGFAILPIPTKKKTNKPLFVAGHVYTLQSTMNLRKDHSVKSKKVGTMPKGKEIAPLKVYKTSNGVYWLQVPYKDVIVWVCGKSSKRLYVK